MFTTVRDVELMAMGELVKMLGVSRTRAAFIAGRPDFPRPVADLIVGKIWAVADVERWAQERGRTLLPLDAPASDAGDA